MPRNLTSPLYKASLIAVSKFSSVPAKHINVHNLLETQDRNIFKKVSNTVDHPLLPFLPRIKSTYYNLRRKSSEKPKIDTVRAMSTYGNRLVKIISSNIYTPVPHQLVLGFKIFLKNDATHTNDQEQLVLNNCSTDLE